MKIIDSIHIKGYRGIKDLKIDKLKKYNIFVGDNSSCKTTLLEALYLSLPITIIGLPYVSNLRGDILTKNNISNFFYNTEIENNIEFILNDELKTTIKNVNSFDNTQIIEMQIDSNIKPEVVLYNIEKSLNGEKIISANVLINNSNYGINADYNLVLPDKITYGEGSFIAPLMKSQSIIVRTIKTLIENKHKKELLDILNLFETGIDDIVSDGKNILLSKKNFQKMMPLSSFGNGLTSILYIISSILDEKANYLFIDEIETGIHYINFEKICKNLIKIAEKRDIQLFITTHSDEFLKTFYKELESEQEDITLYRFQKENNKIDKIHYTKEAVNEAFKDGWDIR